jgi:hypothetical protein
MEDGMSKHTLEAKAPSPSRQASQRERTEALIAVRTSELFERLWPLLGFSFDQDLTAVEVELQRWPGHAWSREMYDEVEALISELATELVANQPQSVDLLRGRTFARSLQ